MTEHTSIIKPYRDQITQLRAQVEALRTALEPFAKEADRYSTMENEDHHRAWASNGVTIGQLRKAKAVLAAGEPKP